MKTGLKIGGGLAWIGLVILFSTFGDRYFFSLTHLLKSRVFGPGMSPSIGLAIDFIPWNCLISLLLCVPILFIRARRREAARGIVMGTILFAFLVMLNLFGIVIWWMLFSDAVGNLDPGFAALKQDAVNDGWTPAEFESLWWFYIVATTGFCVLLTWTTSRMKKQSVAEILSS